MNFTDGKIKIIAEVGSNWHTFEHAKDSIALAKQCGADAVKFQLYDFESLYGFFKVHDVSQCLPIDWLPKLKQKADACEIEFMCSAFSPELLDIVNPYVETHKLASAEMSHVRMLEKLRSFGKPVIMSTGGHVMADVRKALDILGDTPVCVMYCVSEYPARFVNPEDMRRYNCFGINKIGFSDHTTDVCIVVRKAIECGARIIEKHVNLVGVTDTPDAPHSLSLDEFKLYVKAARGDWAEIPWKLGENDMRTGHNRRLIAIKDIHPGETFQEGVNFGIYRSIKHETKALSPWLADKVNGEISKNMLMAGDGIGPSDVDLI
jgi:N-acetylneuraminate synthase